MNVLYAFLDESGNLDFSNGRGASEWYLLTSICTPNPEQGMEAYHLMRQRLLLKGYESDCLHATEDPQWVRDEVFAYISASSNLRIDCVSVRKRRLFPPYQKLSKLYPMIFGYLLQYVFHPYGVDASAYAHVVVLLSKFQAPRKERTALLSSIKGFLKANLSGVPFTVALHSSESHPLLQLVDYCSWALYVQRERDEHRPHESIKHLVKSNFDIFQYGMMDWY